MPETMLLRRLLLPELKFQRSWRKIYGDERQARARRAMAQLLYLPKPRAFAPGQAIDRHDRNTSRR